MYIPMFIATLFTMAKIWEQPSLGRILLKVIYQSQKQRFFSITVCLSVYISGYHVDLVSELPL